jgi:protein-tyrosine phosphatase
MNNLRKGVDRAQEVFHEAWIVMVYCKGGIHRSVVMTCCILISLGFSADEAMALVKARRPVADPYSKGAKSSILKFEEEWNAQKGD